MPSTYRLRALTTARAPHFTPASRRRAGAALVAAAVAATFGIGRAGSADAATILWDGGTTGTGTAWLTGTNWSPDLAGTTGPEPTDLAHFDVMGIGGTGNGGTVIGINPNNPTNNGAANQAIGQILLSGGINRTINNNSGSTPGVLTLNGVGGVLLSNTSNHLTLTLANGAGTSTLGVVLADSGEINVTNSAATIAITSIVSEIGGARSLTKTGAGTLTLNGANTFTGDVNITNGTVNANTLGLTGVAQSLGTSANAVTIGSASTAGTLNYTGAATTTNRNLTAGSQGGTLSHANDITYTGTIGGAGPFYKAGAGTLLLSDTGTINGLSVNVLGGTLRLDNAAVNSNDRIDNSTSVAMFGGTLQFDGQRDVPTTEVVSQFFVGGNHNTIRTTVAGGTASNASISFAGLSHGTAATLAFDIAAGVDVNFASATLSNGIIGGWATIGSDFATVDGGTGNVVAYASTVSNDPAVWGSTDNVKMTANGTLNSAGNVNSVQLADNAGAPVTLTLNAQLGLNSGGLIASAVSGHTIDGTGSITSLGNELYMHVPDATHTLNVNVPVADNGGGNVNLITTGPGTTLLNAANTLNGYVQINSGTLELGASGELGVNTVNVTAGGTLALNGQTKTIGALSGGGAVTLGAGSLTVGANNTSTTHGGVISGTGSLTKVGTGTLSLTGVNTFTGATNVGATDGIGDGGVLVVDADSRFGEAPAAATPGSINLYNGTLRLANGDGVTTVATSGGAAGVVGVRVHINRGVTLNAGNPRIEVPDGQYAEIAGIFADGASGTSPLHKIGGGILDLRTSGNSNNTFTGGVIIDGGTLGIVKDSNLGAIPAGVDPDFDAVRINNGATLKWYSSGGSAGLNAKRGVTIGTGGGVLDYSMSSGVPLVDFPITSAAGNTLTKKGPNTLQMNLSQPDLHGDLVVLQGRVNLHSNTAGGDGNIYLAAGAGTGINNTNVAQLGIGGTGLNLTTTTPQNIVLAPTTGGTNSFEVNLSNTLVLEGVISGTGGLTKGRVAATNGVLTLAGNNTYTGDTTILLGVLRVSGGSAIPDGSAVVLNNPPSGSLARLDVNDSTETIGGLSNSGAGPNLGSVLLGAGTLIVNQDVPSTFSGVISGVGGNLTVNGAGVLTLTGTNTYSGTTTIGGTVQAGAAANLGDGSATNGIAGSGGTLQATGSWSSPARNVSIDAAGFQIDTNGNNVALGNVTGTGTLLKQSAGDLTVNHVRTTTLNVDAGKVVMTPDMVATGVSNVDSLVIAANASLDLKRNKLVTNTPIGSFTAGAYTGVQGEVARAYNFGAWDQPGLTTSEELAGPNAGPLSGTTTIGVATGEQILFLGPTDTGMFAGQTITGATTIAMYTYAGDVNFDGLVDAADYGVIDNWVQFPGTDGYANGDLNYDGVIDAGDYGIIDNTIQLQGPQIPGWDYPYASSAQSGASLSGVTAVPEPTAIGLAVVAAGVLLGRRRRRVR